MLFAHRTCVICLDQNYLLSFPFYHNYDRGGLLRNAITFYLIRGDISILLWEGNGLLIGYRFYTEGEYSDVSRLCLIRL